uniref:SH2 domain-containing protein n=1 Tax=Megaviridae environmental sample TaxID=1737588 RepID=A0A5J6VIC0_9VIRU|nr:MAG: hypothetical protein [Megaviridae environmental sample]
MEIHDISREDADLHLQDKEDGSYFFRKSSRDPTGERCVVVLSFKYNEYTYHYLILNLNGCLQTLDSKECISGFPFQLDDIKMHYPITNELNPSTF